MGLDRLGTDEQRLRDLPRGQPTGRQLRDSAVAGRQGVHAGGRRAAGSCPTGVQLDPGALLQEGRAALVGEIEGAAQRLARVQAAVAPP